MNKYFQLTLNYAKYIFVSFVLLFGFISISSKLYETDNILHKFNQNTTVNINQTKMNLWHLDIMDGYMDSIFRYNYIGNNVNIIIIDYFVDMHSDYAGRIRILNNTSCNINYKNISDMITIYHGSSVVGAAIGTCFGIAKNATIYHYPLCQYQTRAQFDKSIFKNIVDGTHHICSIQKKCILLLPFMTIPVLLKNDIMNNILNSIAETNKFIIVMAAGNNGINLSSSNKYKNVIIVGAYTHTFTNKIHIKKLELSNYGNIVDIYAPGHHIVTTGINNEIISSSGTSMASALVAGWIATILERNHSTTINDVKHMFHFMPSLDDKNNKYLIASPHKNK